MQPLLLPCGCTHLAKHDKGSRRTTCLHGIDYIITAKRKTITEYHIENKNAQTQLFTGA